ncbi:MAG: relA 3 [Bacteroidetes bacterium]|jgi:(p)ppGpp synthase/HD superfamily hydrolase|nr:relA 3 [Bacteroidota bacterium]
MEDLLDKITEYADNAHGEQMRKYTPERYIVHPIRVMKTCRRFTNDICILSAALLHDVLEDTPVQKNELGDFLKSVMPDDMAHRTLDMVIDLTDVFIKKDYPKLNRRARKANELARLENTSPDSQTIKYADIIDNSIEIVNHDPDFARVFLYECRTNLKKLDKGNKELYNEAWALVNGAIESLAEKKKRTVKKQQK